MLIQILGVLCTKHFVDVLFLRAERLAIVIERKECTKVPQEFIAATKDDLVVINTAFNYDHVAFDVEALVPQLALNTLKSDIWHGVNHELGHHIVRVVRVWTTNSRLPVVDIFVGSIQENPKLVLTLGDFPSQKSVTLLSKVCFVRLSLSYAWDKEPGASPVLLEQFRVLSVSIGS